MTQKQTPPALPGSDDDETALHAAQDDSCSEIDDPEDEDEDEEDEEDTGTGFSLTPLLVAVVVAYGGGWKISWGAYLHSKRALLMNDHGLLVRINDLYYGLGLTDRFFDAPFISWLCLIPLFGLLGFRGFVFGQGR